MAWLTNWNRRKSKTINGTTAGAQTNYQMKFTVHKGTGTDTATDVYLGTNVRDDFGDVRFTNSTGSTLLPYWIESYTSGLSATIWVNIDSIPASPNTATIYIYYDNPTALTTSNPTSTFIFFDDFNTVSDPWTEIDPNNHISQDRSTNHRVDVSNLAENEDAFLYADLGVDTIDNFELKYDMLYTSASSGFDGFGSGFSNEIQDIRWSASGIFEEHASNTLIWLIDRSNIVNSPQISVSPNTTYYVTIRRSGSNISMYIYTDPDRTTQISGSPVSITGTTSKFRYIYAIITYNDGNPDTLSGWKTNFVVRNYADPEPSYGPWGSEEMFVCPLPSCNLVVT